MVGEGEASFGKEEALLGWEAKPLKMCATEIDGDGHQSEKPHFMSIKVAQDHIHLRAGTSMKSHYNNDTRMKYWL